MTKMLGFPVLLLRCDGNRVKYLRFAYVVYNNQENNKPCDRVPPVRHSQLITRLFTNLVISSSFGERDKSWDYLKHWQCYLVRYLTPWCSWKVN